MCFFAESTAANLRSGLDLIHSQARNAREADPPDLPKVESLRVKRLQSLHLAAKAAPSDRGARGVASDAQAAADDDATWVSGMRAIQLSDQLIDRMKYADAFAVAHFGWEPFASSDDQGTVFGDVAAQLFKSWQAAIAFDAELWADKNDLAAAYVRQGLRQSLPRSPDDAERMFRAWKEEVDRDPDFWKTAETDESLESHVQELIRKRFTTTPDREKVLLEAWQAVSRESDAFAKAWRSPRLFDKEFDVAHVVRKALKKSVTQDPCHLESVAMLAFMDKPEPSESFQPAEIRESLRTRNRELLKLDTGGSATPRPGTASGPAKLTGTGMPWEAPVEYLKAKSTSFILDDLKYYTGFLDDRSILTGKDRRGEDFSVVMDGLLFTYADDNRSQIGRAHV